MSCKPRILFLDAYDSFSNNIIALLESQCGVHVTKVHIDAIIPNFELFLTPFAAIVCGPGPGHPAHCRDVGLFKHVWDLPDDNIVPVLGICLGFQSLAYEFGASVTPLRQPRHGMKTCVTSSSNSIFEGLPEINTVQYHSLHVVLGQNRHGDTTEGYLWKPSEICPKLQPLAWEFSNQYGIHTRFQEDPRSILMAAKHISKPFCGIQFHPESICSESSAQQVISNWWQEASAWSNNAGLPRLTTDGIKKLDRLEPLTPATEVRTGTGSESSTSNESLDSTSASFHLTTKKYLNLVSATLPVGTLTIPSMCKALDIATEDLIILDSEMRQLPQLGETSVIGIIRPETKRLKYSVGGKHVLLQQGEKDEQINLDAYGGDFFSFIKAFMSDFSIIADTESVFCGGLMGYVNYEACLETIGVSAPPTSNGPDICFALVERSILINHKQQLVHIQGLQMDDLDSRVSHWLDETSAILSALSKNNDGFTSETQPHSFSKEVIQSTLPSEPEYKSKITQCQEKIGTGDSYELCLTDQTSVNLAGNTSSWDMYLNLRRLNPATFAAYVRLGSLTLLSTSPERFMNWSRFQASSTITGDSESELSATCQFRPIKGTVRKEVVRPDGSIHQITRPEATAILATQKEQAENLMIVDLIRHDLYEVCRTVSVEGLMVVEEYEGVYQLVSVIEGKMFKPLSPARPGLDEVSGIDCLAASLPPGSMTGAPKKRSCEILRDIEGGKPRSIYSGVLGYICVSGKGDFSVLIRSMYKWDDAGSGDAEWNIGAGGAVTALSTEDGEWEEMLTKLQSTYCLFR